MRNVSLSTESCRSAALVSMTRKPFKKSKLILITQKPKYLVHMTRKPLITNINLFQWHSNWIENCLNDAQTQWEEGGRWRSQHNFPSFKFWMSIKNKGFPECCWFCWFCETCKFPSRSCCQLQWHSCCRSWWSRRASQQPASPLQGFLHLWWSTPSNMGYTFN